MKQCSITLSYFFWLHETEFTGISDIAQIGQNSQVPETGMQVKVSYLFFIHGQCLSKETATAVDAQFF